MEPNEVEIHFVSPDKDTDEDTDETEANETETDVSLVEQHALEVLEGKWGTTGIQRRLSKHGIDPGPVMAEVERLR